jgi:hypothetical protein
MEQTKRKTPKPKGFRVDEMVNRLDLPLDARLPLITLAYGPKTRSQVAKAARKSGVDVAAGIARLVEEGLVEARDGELHMRPVEAWENDTHFMAALAVRW